MIHAGHRFTRPAQGRLVLAGGAVLLLMYLSILLFETYDPVLIVQL